MGRFLCPLRKLLQQRVLLFGRYARAVAAHGNFDFAALQRSAYQNFAAAKHPAQIGAAVKV